MFQKLYRRGLAALVLGFYWLISRSWSYEHVGLTPKKKARVGRIYAHWHGDELLLAGAYARRGMAVLSSKSRDGELMTWVLKKLGYYVVRGSSSRGAVGGLKGLIDAVTQQSREASVAVDGPRGPIYRVKPGVLKLAQKTGCELVVGAAAASRKYTFEKAWNRCYLPYPFAKCVVVYAQPIQVPADLSDEAFEELRSSVEQKMVVLKRNAEEFFGRKLTADLKLVES